MVARKRATRKNIMDKILRNTLYNLTKRFKTSITIRRLVSNSIEYKKGKQELTTTDIDIKNVILLPRDTELDFVYDLSFIAANKNFTYGGDFNKSESILIVTHPFVPVDFTGFQVSDIIIIGSVEYKVKQASILKENDGFVCIITRSKGYV
jgi:hypothetical protein